MAKKGGGILKNDLSYNGFLLDYKDSNLLDELLLESHCHVQYEIIAVLEGEVAVIFEGKRYHLAKGQCALISPLSYHTVTAAKQERYRRITVLFDKTAMPEVLSEHFPELERAIYLADFEEMRILRAIYKSGDRRLYSPLVESVIIRLLYEILRTGQTEEEPQIDKELSKMLDYVDAHLCESIQLSDIADYVALSKSSVSHIFAEKMKISPKQYILQKKLAYADKLIRDGMSATKAAMKIGYDNYSNFYRMYKKRFNLNPSEK